MRMSLINLGDGTRCLHDAKNRIVSIGVGEIVTADLSDATINLIKKFQKTDTLLMAPEGAIVPPIRLRAILEILRDVDSDPYDRLLRRFFEVSPPSGGGERPSRIAIRAACRGLVEAHLARVMGKGEAKSSEVVTPVIPSPTRASNPPQASRSRRRNRR